MLKDHDFCVLLLHFLKLSLPLSFMNFNIILHAEDCLLELRYLFLLLAIFLRHLDDFLSLLVKCVCMLGYLLPLPVLAVSDHTHFVLFENVVILTQFFIFLRDSLHLFVTLHSEPVLFLPVSVGFLPLLL